MPISVSRLVATKRIFNACTVMSVVGLVGLFITAMAGFEEPDNTSLLFSVLLGLAAPAVVLVHLMFTKELTRREKSLWLRHLAGPHAARVFCIYLTSGDRAASALRLPADISTRSSNVRPEDR
jgi:drug/metabolite transporter (DMT)-like permease